jgi:hypothetical protein
MSLLPAGRTVIAVSRFSERLDTLDDTLELTMQDVRKTAKEKPTMNTTIAVLDLFLIMFLRLRDIRDIEQSPQRC